jgi:Arc-like DNA binding domain
LNIRSSKPKELQKCKNYPDRHLKAPTGIINSLMYTLLTYSFLMAMTTIRVEAEVRDRLAARAEAHGRSLGAELRAMLDEMKREVSSR